MKQPSWFPWLFTFALFFSAESFLPAFGVVRRSTWPTSTVGSMPLSMTNKPENSSKGASPSLTPLSSARSRSWPRRFQNSTAIRTSTTTTTTTTTTRTRGHQIRQKSVKRVRKHAGVALAGFGFASSATRALIANQKQVLSSLQPMVEAMVNFLRRSGIDLELSKSLNFRLLDNVILLSRIQKQLIPQGQDIRDLAAVSENTLLSTTVPSKEEALRYMRYATAAYGDSMIRAANLDVKGFRQGVSGGQLSSDSILSEGKLTKTRVSEHIGVPQDDIVAMDVEYGGDTNHLRHFVAVDHVHQKVVLAIRGTFTISELVVDVAGFSRPFCGGEAHSEMANMAEGVWQVASPIVLDLLKKHNGYSLVLTGHSLGAGVACLLNIMLGSDNDDGLLRVDGRQSVKVQCFAYASPPVFAPKPKEDDDNDNDSTTTAATTTSGTHGLPKAVLSCTNYIHEMDVVPFLSVDSVRHFFKCIAVLEEEQQQHKHKTSWWSLLPVDNFLHRDTALLNTVRRARNERLPIKPGAPLLAVPAATNVWMMRRRVVQQHSIGSNNDDGTYNQRLCDPNRLATLGLRMDLRMLQDHFPARYEHALHHLLVEDDDDDD